MRAGTRVLVQTGSALNGDKPVGGTFVEWVPPGHGQGAVILDTGETVTTWACNIAMEHPTYDGATR